MNTRQINTISIALFLFSTISQIVYGDIVPPNYHNVTRNVKISNVDEFPAVAFVGYVIQFDPQDRSRYYRYGAYEIKSGQTLHMNNAPYSLFGKFIVYAVERSYFEGKGIDNIDFDSDPNVLTLAKDTEIIRPQGYYLTNENPLIEEEVTYTIAGFIDKRLVLYKSKHVWKYNDGRTDKLETFEKPEIPGLRPTFKKPS
ncbi:MAG: hypothetical protein JSU83_06455 [Deltaproteobacteria bacterium]|nr:MAG: hypothetical protein JSU83_06455 [Deltaproteobacteria bacterium]